MTVTGDKVGANQLGFLGFIPAYHNASLIGTFCPMRVFHQRGYDIISEEFAYVLRDDTKRERTISLWEEGKGFFICVDELFGIHFRPRTSAQIEICLRRLLLQEEVNRLKAFPREDWDSFEAMFKFMVRPIHGAKRCIMKDALAANDQATSSMTAPSSEVNASSQVCDTIGKFNLFKNYLIKKKAHRKKQETLGEGLR